MAQVEDFTSPLSGYDPIEDVVGQVRKYLRMDCSLRKEDGYSGGFKGKIKIELDCYAVKVAHIATEVPITIPPAVKTALDALPPEEVETFKIDETLDIPLEPNLAVVRERIKDNGAENLNAPAESTEPEEVNEFPVRQRRTYRKREPLPIGAAAE